MAEAEWDLRETVELLYMQFLKFATCVLPPQQVNKFKSELVFRCEMISMHLH